MAIEGNTVLAVSGIVIALISGSFALVGSYQTKKASDKKVDAEAYQRAQSIYERALDEVQSQLERLRQENTELIARNERLNLRLNELEDLIGRMRRMLIDQGISIDTLMEKKEGS